ncbi:MAG: hypothetical protein ABL952_01085 [Pyrinomonadaceae bacterium]
MKLGRIVGIVVLVIVLLVIVRSVPTLTIPGRSSGFRMVLSALIPLAYFAYYRAGAIGFGVAPMMLGIFMIPLWLLWVFAAERTGLGILALAVLVFIFPLVLVIMALRAKEVAMWARLVPLTIPVLLLAATQIVGPGSETALVAFTSVGLGLLGLVAVIGTQGSQHPPPVTTEEHTL